MNPTIYDELVADGWREYPNGLKPHSRCFYKRFDTLTKCAFNDDKSGLQIEIATTEQWQGSVSIELELIAMLKDRTWLRIRNYALPKTLKEVTALIPRMLSVWESANKE